MLLPPNIKTHELVLLKEDLNIQGHLRYKKKQKSFSRDIHLLFPLLYVRDFFFNKRNFKQESLCGYRWMNPEHVVTDLWVSN